MKFMKRSFLLFISLISTLCLSAQESYLTIIQQTILDKNVQDISFRFMEEECIGYKQGIKKHLIPILKGEIICLMPSKYSRNTNGLYLEANAGSVKITKAQILANYKRIILPEEEEQEFYELDEEQTSFKSELAELELQLNSGDLNQDEYNTRSDRIRKLIQQKEERYQMLSEKFNVAFEQQNYLRLFEGVDMLVTKVSENKLTVKIGELEFRINSDFNRLLFKDKVEELSANIAQMCAEAEEKAQEEHERKITEWKQNLDLYYSLVEKMHYAPAGPIVVKKKEREYDATIRFRDFYQKKQQNSDFDSFLDEKYVFNIKDILSMISKYEDEINNPTSSVFSRDLAAEELRKLRAMETDTFAISRITTNNRQKWHFIDLRTGEPFDISNASRVESVSYLNNLSKVKDLVYDGKYSIVELLSINQNKVDYSEIICKSLIGEKIFLIGNNEYDEISNVELVNGKYKVILKSNGEITDFKDIIAIKWYKELQKHIGKEVVVANVYNLSLEDLSKNDIWIIDKIEIEKKEYLGLGLYITCSKGDKTAWADAAACTYLTHKIDFEHDKEYIHGNTSGFEGTYGNILLLYEYVKANATRKPKSQKR